jgi:crotonobetainyl-CoA:carnitine CoA-transferase CaiB-like acyl-CoA transferase
LVNGDKLSIAPSLGQHTKEIIKGLGYSEDFITKLLDEEVIFGL